MAIHPISPSENSLGTAVITPHWLFVLAAATPAAFRDPILADESIEPLDPETIQFGDIVGTSVHTGNALRGYEVGRLACAREPPWYTAEYTQLSFPKNPSRTDLQITCGLRGRRHRVGAGPDGCPAWSGRPHLRGKQNGGRPVPGGTLGLDAGRQIQVGLCADDSRLPQALLRLANRWPKPRQRSFKKMIDEIIDLRQRIPLHGTRRRQRLCCDADRPSSHPGAE